jgi:hypothetical protein
LNTVKVVFGFVELALAFKFLSNADLVLQLHLLEREVFIAIWIAIFGTLTLYLFGKIILPHDSPLTHISVGRLLFGLLVLTFTVYLIPGLWGAPLKDMPCKVFPLTDTDGQAIHDAFHGRFACTMTGGIVWGDEPDWARLFELLTCPVGDLNDADIPRAGRRAGDSP